jgi:hypothetical protein
MSLVTFNNVRYYTDTDVYHYTVDNRPLQDLASNDVLLQAGLDILAAAITGTGITAKDFIGGTDFTAGTTTSLALSGSPPSITSLWIFFNGVYQNYNTYTLSGNVITFGSPIPLGITSIEIKWSNASGTNSYSTTSVLSVNNANISLPVARDIVVVYSGALIANYMVTLSTTATQGYKVRVLKDSTATGAFSVTVSNGSTLKIITGPSVWADFIYTGTTWIETASGSL